MWTIDATDTCNFRIFLMRNSNFDNIANRIFGFCFCFYSVLMLELFPGYLTILWLRVRAVPVKVRISSNFWATTLAPSNFDHACMWSHVGIMISFVLVCYVGIESLSGWNWFIIDCLLMMLKISNINLIRLSNVS